MCCPSVYLTSCKGSMKFSGTSKIWAAHDRTAFTDGLESCQAKTAVDELREETNKSQSKCLDVSSLDSTQSFSSLASLMRASQCIMGTASGIISSGNGSFFKVCTSDFRLFGRLFNLSQSFPAVFMSTLKEGLPSILVAGCPARVQAQANTFFCSSVAVLRQDENATCRSAKRSGCCHFTQANPKAISVMARGCVSSNAASMAASARTCQTGTARISE
mmetsp:Transcript_69478/g.140782  ORF Transcript_69478/g.140782 Transcript_69478/m.140782 type:complete len:218 (-) Transcript_69478:469-1122(-)